MKSFSIKKYLAVLLILPLFFVAALATAEDSYVCSFEDKEIVISVVYSDPHAKLPCEVLYKNAGRLESIWDELENEGVCEQKALEFARQHYNWGWSCDDIALPVEIVPPVETFAVVVPTLPAEQIAAYKKSAAFAQVMATLSPFKMRMMEYFAMEGHYPDSLHDFGLNPIDMKTSSFISNLTIGAKGKIYAQGNEAVGLNTVILLRPVETLGGLGNEWKCTTNIKLRGFDYCTFDIRLVYPD